MSDEPTIASEEPGFPHPAAESPSSMPAGGGPEATATAREIEILRVALRDSNAERATLKGLLTRAGSTLPIGLRRSLDLVAAPQHPRVTMLERVRRRLNDTNDRLVRERDEARERAAVLQSEIDDHRSAREDVSNRYVELQDRQQSTEDALFRAQARVRELSADRELAAERISRLRQDVLELERRMSSVSGVLLRNATMVRSFEESHERAAESIAALEHERRQLEFELASRLTHAEAKAIDATLAIQRLVAERALLAETLALRERRIANLEGALREVTVDFVRATEVELERYRAALASVEASPVGRLRAWIHDVLRRPAEASRAAKSAIVLPRRRRRKRSKPGGDRHLRSA